MSKLFRSFDYAELLKSTADSENHAAKWNVLGYSGERSYVFIALQPNTYIEPHCHPDPLLLGPPSAQFSVAVNGKVGLVLIDPKTRRTGKWILNSQSTRKAVEIPGGVYHSYVALSRNAVVMEIVNPNLPTEVLVGSPKAGTPEAKELVKYWASPRTLTFKPK